MMIVSMLMPFDRTNTIISEDGMDRTGFEPASHYLTDKHVTNYTTGPREF
jgi:hypothetical protein